MRYLLGGVWNPEKGRQQSGPSSYSNRAGVVVNDDVAMQVGAVFRCIRLIAETCASLPMIAYQRVGEFDRTPLPNDHWLPRLICEPNETMTGDELRESMVAQMAGWGNSYSQIVPNAAGQPVEVWPYRVDRMTVDRNEDRTLRYTYPNTFGTPQVLSSNRVLHLRAFSLDGVMGLSPLGLARQTLGLAVGAQAYAASFFGSGGRPSGVLTSDKLLTDKQREQIRKEFGGLADGGTDGKRLWVLEAALKYEPVTVSPEDMQMLQTRQFEVSEIARFFGVPLHLLMETEKATSWGSGLEQQNIAFLIYTLRPYLQRLSMAFNRWIIPEAERAKIFVDIDETALLRGDMQATASYLSTLVQNGLMTRNEARRRLQLSRVEGGDDLTVQVNLTPIQKLGEVTPQQVQAIKDLQQRAELGEDARVVPFRAPSRVSE